MMAEMSQEELLKVKSLLDKHLKQTPKKAPSKATSHKNGSSSSKSAGRSSQKSVNASNVNGNDEDHEIVNEETEEDEDSSDMEDEDVTFRRLSKKKDVTMVRGGHIHMDENGQAWKKALGHAVKFHCRNIDLGWKEISADIKKKLVDHMEANYGKGPMGRNTLYDASRQYNHWKNYLTRSKTETAPLYITPEVWTRFQENAKADHAQQKKAAAARTKDPHRWGRRGINGMLADYYRDWGSYPSAVTIKKIKDKGTYKLYRESVIAEGRVPGNFRSLDHVGKKGEKKNKQRKRQRKENMKEKMKGRELHEGALEDGADDLPPFEQDVDGLRHEEHVNFVPLEEEFNREQGDENDGNEMELDIEKGMHFRGLGKELEEDQVVGEVVLDEIAHSTPLWAQEMMEEQEGTAAKEKEEGATKKKDKKGKGKKGKKGRGIGRNLSPDFVEADVAKNIAKYRSIQRGK